ncbi:DUF1800 domain-containing protein [Thiomonas sp. FB-6]|uniref:DUF1800 domain-containing protein n=1 Tax=Thiomonas sp. FB-6 TaxID=1158291 RepID=UPI00037908CC|nr:DUF1800 domain-containing protein [Thiomonas sp. FB-6]
MFRFRCRVPRVLRLGAPMLLLAGCACAAQASTAADLDAGARAHPLAFLDRIGWGADPAQLRQLREQGATRLLDAQLRPDPDPTLPPQLARSLAALPVNAPLEQLIAPLVEQRRQIRMSGGAAGSADAGDAQARLKDLRQRMNALTRQAMAQQLLLAVYAPNQLQQRLSWFWMNHFNVFHGFLVGPMMADYQMRVIEPHALGHFRDLLRATMFSPQMLLYLNNAQNARGHINENYARELMELHTLGVGSGYTQADVTHLAHALTGLGVDLAGRPVRVRPAWRGLLWQRGLVVFNPARHDSSPQLVLGHTLQGDSVDEMEQVVDLLADDPATAKHLCLELARYFVADHPDPAMVAAMVRSWQRSDGDIAAVLRTMYRSPQFAASLASPQFKDPMRYVISSVRAGLAGPRLIRNPQPMLGALAALGEPLFGRSTPDGYPVGAAAWDGSGAMTTRFRIAQQFGAGAPALFGEPPPYLREDGLLPAEAQPKGPRGPAPELARSPVYLAAEPGLSGATRQVLAQAGPRVRWNALWLASPEFMNQ